jgi:hypothetical protein
MQQRARWIKCREFADKNDEISAEARKRTKRDIM